MYELGLDPSGAGECFCSSNLARWRDVAFRWLSWWLSRNEPVCATRETCPHYVSRPAECYFAAAQWEAMWNISMLLQWLLYRTAFIAFWTTDEREAAYGLRAHVTLERAFGPHSERRNDLLTSDFDFSQDELF
jgi:hypothetical protein